MASEPISPPTGIRYLEGPQFRRWVLGASVAGAVAYTVALIGNLALDADSTVRVWAQSLTVAACAAAAVLAWRGHVVTAARLSLAAATVELHATIPFQGPEAAALIALPVLVVAAGFVLGGRGGLVMAAASSAVLVGGTWTAHGLLGVPADDLGWTLYLVVVTIASEFVAAVLILAGSTAYGSAVARSLEGERRVAELVRFAPDGIVALDGDGRVTSMNPAGERLLATEEGAALGRRLVDVIVDRTRPSLSGAAHAALEGEHEAPLELLHPSGGSVWVEFAVVRRVAADGTETRQLTLRDATERRVAEEQARLLQSQIEHAQRMESVGRLAGGVAHDFNNVFTVIGGSSELLIQGGDPEVATLGREILSAKNRGASLTRKLLAFARREVIQPRLLHFGHVVAQMQPLLARLMGDGLLLRTELADAPPALADPAQVEQLLINLATNARDAVDEGGTITIGLAGPGADRAWARGPLGPVPRGHLELWVADDGIGMDEETRARIFEPFFSTKAQEGGVGLGMASVHGTVTQNGGRIEVESEEGRGSLVRVFWPLDKMAGSGT